jgi:NADH-quinone oxidoreductase subunit B
MFNNYALVQGVDTIVPVDVYAPGCPPGPETLIHSINTLHELIQSGELTRRREASGRGAEVHLDEHDGDTEAVISPAGPAGGSR